MRGIGPSVTTVCVPDKNVLPCVRVIMSRDHAKWIALFRSLFHGVERRTYPWDWAIAYTMARKQAKAVS